MKRIISVLSLIGFVLTIMAWHGTALSDECNRDKNKNSSECCKRKEGECAPFEKMKKLTGTWKGTQVKDGKKQTVTVTYHLTSGNSALVETLFPGTPMEMVSVYTPDKKSVRMTHYCMLGNQPNMVLNDWSKGEFNFKFAKSPGIRPSRDSYMGALTLTMKDKNHLKHEWSFYEKGKEKQVEVFDLVRQ